MTEIGMHGYINPHCGAVWLLFECRVWNLPFRTVRPVRHSGATSCLDRRAVRARTGSQRGLPTRTMKRAWALEHLEDDRAAATHC